MVSPVFFGLRSVFLFAARHAGRGDAVRLVLFLLFFRPAACLPLWRKPGAGGPCGGTGHRASPGALLLQQELV